MISRLIVCMAAAGLVTSVPVLAAIDGMEAARSSAGMTLRWENIQGAPYWVSGAAPRRSTRRDWYVVELGDKQPGMQPGMQPDKQADRQADMQGVALHVPAHALLRVIADKSENDSTDSPVSPPRVAISNGTGLAVEHKPIPGADGRSWLIKSDAAHPVVIHLHRATESSAPQRVALFLGHLQEPAAPVVYRHDLPLEGESVPVRQADEALARDYVRMPADDALTVTVRGPDRLLLEYRLDEMQSAGTAALTMSATLDEQPARLIHQLTGPETSEPVQVGGAWRMAGRLERVALDIPAGKHRLRLRSSHELLLRAALERNSDFLLPQFNLSGDWHRAASDTALEELEQKSVAAAISNQWRGIGALAQEPMQREAGLRRGGRALLSATDELQRAFTRYRDLLPAEPTEVTTLSVVTRLPQSPQETRRSHVMGPELAYAPAALVRFHQIDDRPVRFALPNVPYPVRMRALVPAEAGKVQIEVQYDNGAYTSLSAGEVALSEEDLQPASGGPVTASESAWPHALGGHADRASTPAVLTVAAGTEWQVPPNVKSMTVRAVEGRVPLALQWMESAEYALDDQLLARLAQKGASGGMAAPLMQAALRSLKRRLAAARAQFTAGVAPPADSEHERHERHEFDEPAARAAAEAARQESDPARAVDLWGQAMQSGDTSLQAQALRGMAGALILSGERFAAERVLRSWWIGDNAALSRVAQEELEALYAREGDREKQALFFAARAASDESSESSYAVLGQALAAAGDDETALLVGLAATERNVPALLQSALRAGKWRTFDALAGQLDEPRERAFWQAQRALSFGRIEEAEQSFVRSGANDWNKALEEGRSISGRLFDDEQERLAAVNAWLQWQARHPGPRLWQSQPGTVVQHDGGVYLRSIALGSRSTWWRASSAQPLVARVVGPARIRVEARPLHSHGDSLLNGWLRVSTGDQLWLQPFHQNQPTTGLELDARAALPGTTVVREIELPAGVHELHIDAGEVPVVTRLQVERPALQLPVLPAPVAAHFESHSGYRANAGAASACGTLASCRLVVDGSLNAISTSYEPAQWHALPAPAREQDPVAARLAQDDIDGALAVASDPVERMRLLLWLAEARPAERPRAMALAAALANRHPQPDIRALWNQLAPHSGWTVLTLVDRSAGLRRTEVPHGTPQSSTARIRAAMLPPLRRGEVRIGAGSRASLLLDELSPGSLTLELTADQMPGDAPLPMHARIERNGRLLRAVPMHVSNGTMKVPLSLATGGQRISVSLQDPYSNQYLRVRFSGPRQPEPTVVRDWHIATSQQPVRATVSGPAWIRIDRLNKDGVRSEHRLLTEPVSTLVLQPHDGAAESLYRIHQLRVHPNPSVSPPPRPAAYVPTPLPAAPAEWHARVKPAPQQVRFVDQAPLEGQRGSTVSARVSLQRRRDVEASGALHDPVPERFVETGIAWRKGSADQSQFRFAELFLRDREYGSNLLGFRLRAEQDVRWLAALPRPFKLKAALSGFAQDTPGDAGRSLLFEAEISQKQRLTSTVSHEPSIAFHARAMNLDEVGDRELVDTDVFSAYRHEHKRGLTLGDTVSWRPWRDTHLSASISATTNPDFRLGSVDHHRASVQWRQLAGPLIVEFGARATRYWSDEERTENITRRELSLGASGDWWLDAGTRVEVRAELRRDIDDSSSWGGVQLRWHWGPGRQLRDFSSSELDFSAIRSWRMPAPHHRIEEK